MSERPVYHLNPLLLVAAIILIAGGCKSQTIGAFTITDITLLTGVGSPPRLIECSTLEGSQLWTHQDGYPKQPIGGDWSEDDSPYQGNLLKSGDHAYQCATARVEVQRNPNVEPGTDWYEGDRVYLKVVAPHFCGNLNPGEDSLQPLTYIARATQDQQTTFVFDQVIVASECGVGPYSEEYGEGHTVHFGQAPDEVGEPLQPAPTTNQLDCLLIVGFQMNFNSCQAL